MTNNGVTKKVNGAQFCLDLTIPQNILFCDLLKKDILNRLMGHLLSLRCVAFLNAAFLLCI